MSETHTANPLPRKAPKPLTALQELEKQHKELRGKMQAEKRRIKLDRISKKERVHVLTILGSIIDHAGKGKVAQALAKAGWLAEDDKRAVKHYYGLLDDEVIEKQEEKVQSDGEPV